MTRKSLPSLLTLLIFIVCTGSAGEIYKWVDEQGHIHYGDKPPQNREVERVDAEINSISTPEVSASDFLEAREKNRKKSVSAPAVVMYSTTWCGVCKKARRFFQANNIPFSEYDVEHSERGRADYEYVGRGGVPIIFVGSKMMRGFSSSRFISMYESEKKVLNAR